jgi:hypothetical protein
MEGIRTLFGHTVIQREHAVHFLVKFSIPAEPGGQTGNFLFSLTVDAFVGFGAETFCPDDEFDKPKKNRTEPAITFRRSISVSCSFFLNVIIPYDSALSGQLFRQLKHPTHLDKSISLLRKSIHDDLQAREHLPQRVHLVSLNLILRKDVFEIRPSNVPTGQIVLQYKRPFAKDIIPTRSRNAEGMPDRKLFRINTIGLTKYVMNRPNIL